jgi:hypothetical protein
MMFATSAPHYADGQLPGFVGSFTSNCSMISQAFLYFKTCSNHCATPGNSSKTLEIAEMTYGYNHGISWNRTLT